MKPGQDKKVSAFFLIYKCSITRGGSPAHVARWSGTKAAGCCVLVYCADANQIYTNYPTACFIYNIVLQAVTELTSKT